MVARLRRVFAATSIPPEVRLAIAERIEGLELPGTLAPIDNWHITLRFLNSVDEVTYERFLAGLSEQDLGPSFKLGLGGLGAFPNTRKATVFWIGVGRGSEALLDLANSADAAAADAGLDSEERPFVPHLTLSRIRPPENVTDFLEAASFGDIVWNCESLTVFESHLGSGPAHYEPLERFVLKR